MLCQACGIEAPTKYVEFHQNIGLILFRFKQSMKGDLCRTCINKYFWQFTVINLLAGWWGIISALLTPVNIVSNVFWYLGARRIPVAPSTAVVPQLTRDVISKVDRESYNIESWFEAGISLDEIAERVAIRSGVSPGQVLLCLLLVPETENILASLNTGDPVLEVANTIAERTGLQSVHVFLYIADLIGDTAEEE